MDKILNGSDMVGRDDLLFTANSMETADWRDFIYSPRVRCLRRTWFEISRRGSQADYMRCVTQNTGAEANKFYGTLLAGGYSVDQCIAMMKRRDNLMMWNDPAKTGWHPMLISYVNGGQVKFITVGLYETASKLIQIGKVLQPETWPRWAMDRFNQLIESSRRGFSSSWKDV